MEERIIDQDEGRKIKVTRTAAGGIGDAVEEGVAAEEQAEEEVVLDLPEIGEEADYDEDLVGLTPSQLQKVLEARAKAQEARDKLLAAAEQSLAAADYKQAEGFFTQALVYDADCLRAKEGIWAARTENFTVTELFYDKKNAKKIAEEEDGVKAYIRSQIGERLSAERAEYEKEAEPLSARVNEARDTRRAAFAENRKYYLVRFSVFLALAALFAIGAGVSIPFIWRTQSILPIVLAGVFGAICLAMLVVVVLYSRKLYVACRLCSMNEKLNSTEEGKRLAFLQERIGLLDLILTD